MVVVACHEAAVNFRKEGTVGFAGTFSEDCVQKLDAVT